MEGASADAAVAKASYLGRLLDVVAAVAAGPGEGLSVSELAELTETPLSTVSRLVRVLEQRAFVQRLPSRRLVAGTMLTTLGLRSLRGMPGRDDFHAAVTALGELTGESASVALLIGDEITLVARHESRHPLRFVASVGDLITPHRAAVGKAILAHLDGPRQRAVLARVLGTDAEAVLADLSGELEEAARAGFARDEETFAVGLRCIAAPLLDGRGEAFGGVSISGPTVRFTRELADSFVARLIAAAQDLARLSPGEAAL